MKITKPLSDTQGRAHKESCSNVLHHVARPGGASQHRRLPPCRFGAACRGSAELWIKQTCRNTNGSELIRDVPGQKVKLWNIGHPKGPVSTHSTPGRKGCKGCNARCLHACVALCHGARKARTLLTRTALQPPPAHAVVDHERREKRGMVQVAERSRSGGSVCWSP